MRGTRGLPKLQAAEKKTNAKCKAGAAARTEDEVYFMTLEPEPRRIWSPFASQTLHQPKRRANRVGGVPHVCVIK